jgi:hypothetical protein
MAKRRESISTFLSWEISRMIKNVAGNHRDTKDKTVSKTTKIEMDMSIYTKEEMDNPKVQNEEMDNPPKRVAIPRGELKCTKCCHLFKTQGGLTRHTKKNNCSLEGKIACDQCGGYYAGQYLRAHKKKACPMRAQEPEDDPSQRIAAELEAVTAQMEIMATEMSKLKERAAEDAERITLSEKTERTITLPKGTKFTNAQAINMMQLERVHPMGVEGSHEIDEYVVNKLVQEVKFPQPGMNKDERVKKTARVLQSATKLMLDTHQGSRNMVMASDLGYRMVYLYVTLSVGDESQASLHARTLADAILTSYTLSVEAICDHLSTKLGKEWEKVADTLEQTFKEHEGQIVSMSKDEFERILQGLYTEVQTCLTSTPLWRKETLRQQKKREAAVGVVPV